jgi:hypothetical protein
MGDRRFARRVPKIEMVELRGQEPAGAGIQIRARLFDVSMAGAGLITDRPVRVASLVRFDCDGRERTASVRHCKRAPEGFMIGVEFEDSPA